MIEITRKEPSGRERETDGGSFVNTSGNNNVWRLATKSAIENGEPETGLSRKEQKEADALLNDRRGALWWTARTAL